MIAMLLDQLLEKKDIELYLKLRMEFLGLIEHSEKMKRPIEKRELLDERFRGRHDELKKLQNIIVEGKLKNKSKNYYRKIKNMNSDQECENGHIRYKIDE